MPTTDLALTGAERSSAPPAALPERAPSGPGNAATAAAAGLGPGTPTPALPEALGLLGEAAVWVLDSLPFPIAFDLALVHRESDWARAWLARVEIATAARLAGNAWGRFLDLQLPDGGAVEVGGGAEVAAGPSVERTRSVRVARRGMVWSVTRARSGAVSVGVGQVLAVKGADQAVVGGGAMEAEGGLAGEEVSTWNVSGAEAFGSAAGTVEHWSGAGQLLVLARVLDCCEARAPDACAWRAGPAAEAVEAAELMGLAHADVVGDARAGIAVGWEGGDSFVEAELGAELRLAAFSGVWDLIRRRAAAPAAELLTGLGVRVRVRVWGDLRDALERDDPGDLQFDATATWTAAPQQDADGVEAVRAPTLAAWLRSLARDPVPTPSAGSVVHARDLPDRTLVRSARRSLDPAELSGRLPALAHGLAELLPAHGLTTGATSADLDLTLAVSRAAVVSALGGEDAVAGIGEPEEVLLMLARALGSVLLGDPAVAPAPLDAGRALPAVEVREARITASARLAAGLGLEVSPFFELGGGVDGWVAVERTWSIADRPPAELIALARSSA